jgi:hypothetical protein
MCSSVSLSSDRWSFLVASRIFTPDFTDCLWVKAYIQQCWILNHQRPCSLNLRDLRNMNFNVNEIFTFHVQWNEMKWKRVFDNGSEWRDYVINRRSQDWISRNRRNCLSKMHWRTTYDVNQLIRIKVGGSCQNFLICISESLVFRGAVMTKKPQSNKRTCWNHWMKSMIIPRHPHRISHDALFRLIKWDTATIYITSENRMAISILASINMERLAQFVPINRTDSL